MKNVFLKSIVLPMIAVLSHCSLSSSSGTDNPPANNERKSAPIEDQKKMASGLPVLKTRSFEELIAELSPGFVADSADKQTVDKFLEKVNEQAFMPRGYEFIRNPGHYSKSPESEAKEGASCKSLFNGELLPPIDGAAMNLSMALLHIRTEASAGESARPVYSSLSYESQGGSDVVVTNQIVHIGKRGSDLLFATELRYTFRDNHDQDSLARCVYYANTSTQMTKTLCAAQNYTSQDERKVVDTLHRASFGFKTGALSYSSYDKRQVQGEKASVTAYDYKQTASDKISFVRDFREDSLTHNPYMNRLYEKYQYAEGELTFEIPSPESSPRDCKITKLTATP